MAANQTEILVAGSSLLAEQLQQFGFEIVPTTLSFDEALQRVRDKRVFRSLVVLTHPSMRQVCDRVITESNAAGVPTVVAYPPGTPDSSKVDGPVTHLVGPTVLNDIFEAMGYVRDPDRGEVPLAIIRNSKPAPATPAPIALPDAPTQQQGAPQHAQHTPGPSTQQPEPKPTLPPNTPSTPQPDSVPAPSVPVLPSTAASPRPSVPAPADPTPSIPAGPSIPTLNDSGRLPGPSIPADPGVPAAASQPTQPPQHTTSEDVFQQLHGNPRAPQRAASAHANRYRVAETLIVMAWKGGVSKTTTSYALAQRAAEAGIGRVLLVDGNRGQGGIRSLLRLEQHPSLPTIHDLSYSDVTPQQVICTPETLNASRRQLAPVEFSVVLAPPVRLGNPKHTPADLYTRLLDYAHTNFDLIVVDTQTLDAESSDLFDNTFIPKLRQGAWALALTDPSRESVNNLPDLFNRLHDSGVNSSRVMFAATLWKSEFTPEMAATYTRHFAQRATFAGSTLDDADFAATLDTGIVDTSSPVISPLINNVLSTVTGLDVFAEHESTAPPPRKGFRWFRSRGR